MEIKAEYHLNQREIKLCHTGPVRCLPCKSDGLILTPRTPMVEELTPESCRLSSTGTLWSDTPNNKCEKILLYMAWCGGKSL